MCGIVGAIQYESEVPREIRQKALRILFSSAMLRTEVRGEDATGVFQVHRNGDWLMTKNGVKVSEWVFQEKGGDDPITYSEVMDAWSKHPEETSAVIGHCRKATIGSKGRDNDDNHPFSIQVDERNAILGIHNGTLKNHEVIYDNLPPMLKRQGTVDSESIFHLLFHLSGHGEKPFDGKMITDLGQRLDGAFACITSNTKFPHQVATFRDGRPLEYFLITPLNIVLIVSEKKFGEDALSDYAFFRHVVAQDLPALESHNSALLERDWRIFDTTREFPKSKPTYGDLEKISDTGQIKQHNTAVLKGWGVPEPETKTSTATKSTPNTAQSNSGTHTGVVSKPSAANPGQTTGAAAATNLAKRLAEAEAEDDTGTVVEVELPGNTDEAKAAVAKAKSLGASPTFENMKELAEALGKTVPELTGTGVLAVANLIGQLGFNLGYAVSRHDTDTEANSLLGKGRKQNLRLEQLEGKLSSATKRVWESKALMAIVYALNTADRSVTTQTVSAAINAFKKIEPEQKESMMTLFEEIFADKKTKELIVKIQEQRPKKKKDRVVEEQ